MLSQIIEKCTFNSQEKTYLVGKSCLLKDKEKLFKSFQILEENKFVLDHQVLSSLFDLLFTVENYFEDKKVLEFFDKLVSDGSKFLHELSKSCEEVKAKSALFCSYFEFLKMAAIQASSLGSSSNGKGFNEILETMERFQEYVTTFTQDKSFEHTTPKDVVLVSTKLFALFSSLFEIQFTQFEKLLKEDLQSILSELREIIQLSESTPSVVSSFLLSSLSSFFDYIFVLSSNSITNLSTCKECLNCYKNLIT